MKGWMVLFYACIMECVNMMRTGRGEDKCVVGRGHGLYSTELKHWLQKSIGLPFFLLALMTAHHSCKKETELPPDTVEVEQGKDYLTIDLDRTNQLEVTREGTYHYAIQTTGVDPYLYLEGLNDPNPADSVVLTFEYQSSARINDLQVFFGPP